MRLTVRRAQLTDADALRSLAIETFRATYAAANTADDMEAYITYSFGLDHIRSLLLGPRVAVLLLIEEGRMRGYAQLKQGEATEIERFYLAADLHGKGAAQLLMQEVIRVATEQRATALRLGVWEMNRRAIAFYTKLGFRKIGEQTFQLGSDAQNDWTMELQL